MLTIGGLEWFYRLKQCSDVEIIFMHYKGSDEFSSNKSFRWLIREDDLFNLNTLYT